MKKFFLSFAACLLLATTAFGQDLKYVDARELNLIGKIAPTPHPYHRVDTAKYNGLNAAENRLVRCTPGLALLFKTNSTRIGVKTRYAYRSNVPNSPYIAIAGYDLHIRHHGEWLYAASAVERDENKTLVLVENMDNTTKECLLYLPMYSEPASIEIAVDEGATIESLENTFRHRIVIFGSSFTHGSSISRSGMSYPMQIERNTGLYIMNLGVSGNSKLQPEFARILADAQADAFLFDAFSNPDAKMIQERLLPFIDRIRQAHPKTPLIFLQTIYREKGNFDLKVRASEEAKRAMAEKMMALAMEKYEDVYFVNVPNVTGTDHLTSTDGVHPSDLGYYRWAQAIQPEILKILKTYGIE